MPGYAPEKLSVFQKAQIGIEATPVTAVPATVRLQSIDFQPSINASVSKFTAQGNLTPSVVALGQESTTGKYTVQPCYDEIQYVFASAISKLATGSYSLTNSNNNVPDTYTLEKSQGTTAGAACKVPGVVFTGFNLKWTPKTLALDGDFVGSKMDTAATATSGLTDADVIPILPQHLTSIKLASVAQTRVFGIDLSLSGHWDLLFAAGNVNAVNIVEKAPDCKLSLLMEMDAQAATQLAAFRGTNATQALEIIFTNGTKIVKIEAGIKVSDAKELKDEQGVYAITFEYELVYLAALSAALKVTIT